MTVAQFMSKMKAGGAYAAADAETAKAETARAMMLNCMLDEVCGLWLCCLEVMETFSTGSDGG